VELSSLGESIGFDGLLLSGHVPEVVEWAAAAGGVEGGVHRQGR